MEKDETENKTSTKKAKTIEKKTKTDASKEIKDKSNDSSDNKETEKKNEIWFDDVDPILLEGNSGVAESENTDDVTENQDIQVTEKDIEKALVKENSFTG